MFIYVLIVLKIITLFVYWYITKTFDFWKKKNIAFPIPVPLFGNIKESALRKKFMGCLHKEFYDEFPNEKIVGIYRMTAPCVLIRDLNLIKEIMVKDFHIFGDRGIEFSKEGLGANIFHADGETWRILRTRFTPLFTSVKLKNMCHLISDCADRFIEHFKLLCCKQTERDVQFFIRMYTLSSITACAFGIDTDFDDPRIKDLKKLDKLVLEIHYGLELDMLFPGIMKKLNICLFPKEVTKYFNDLVKNVFAQRNGVPSGRKDFMDLILEMRQQKTIHCKTNTDEPEFTLELTDSVIAAQVAVFYMAGFETSSTTVSFLLYELSQFPDVQDKLIAEIDECVENNNGNITYEVLMSMTYLSKVLDETLRKYPVVDPLLRKCSTDYKVPGSDLIIEKGQCVVVSALGIHMDENYYPNPKIFDPERFSAENSKLRHPGAYIPFGIGPRNCLGMRFAKLQSFMIVVKFLSQFRVEPSANTTEVLKINPRLFIMSPDNGVLLNVVPRYHV